MRWLVWLALIAGCSWYEPLGDGMRNARPIEHLDPPRGIWQGPNAPPGTVRDCCNISTHRGFWASRPGKQAIMGVVGALWTSHPRAIAEFVPDERYKTNAHYAVVVVASKIMLPKIIRNSQQISDLATGMHDEYEGSERRLDYIQCLWKFHKSTEDDGTKVYDFAPALLFSNGLERPFVYHQRHGYSLFELLESLDGGDTDITYLADPPRGKYLAVFKERIFSLNVLEAGNRLYHTGPTDELAWVCNTWPAEYNLDVGSGNEEITGVKVFRDWLVIFKENSIWVLSGDGVGGIWEIQEIDGINGALEWCVEDIGHGLMFFNRTGAYIWSGGMAKRVSHPQLQEIWPRLSFDTPPQTGYDPERRLVFFSFGSGESRSGGHQTLVYDLNNKAWTRWGTWRGDDGVPRDYSHATLFVPLRKFFDHPVLAFSSQLRLFKWGGDLDERVDETPPADVVPIHWFIQTQRLFDKDPGTKIARRMMLATRRTGDWSVFGLVCEEGEGPIDAMRRRAGDKWNLIMDSANAASHEINGQSKFMRSSDGPVDVLFPPGNYKIGDSLRVISGTDSDKVVFDAAFNSTGMAGHLLVIPEDISGIVQFSMLNGDLMGDVAGDTIYQEPDFEKLHQSINATGRNFTLWLSNVGDYNVSAGEAALGWYAKKGVPFEALGWGIWVVPTGAIR